MLLFDIKPLLKARGVKRPYSFLVANGFTYSAANMMIYTNKRTIKFDQLEMLCDLLKCTPNDLMVWRPKAGVQYPKDYPLNGLKRKAIADEWMDVVAAMPLEKLKELAQEVMDRNNEGD